MDDVRLTAAELRVLELRVRDGLSLADIARKLGREPRTVSNHFNIIYQKLGVAADLNVERKHDVATRYYRRREAANRSASPRDSAGDEQTASTDVAGQVDLAPFVAGPPILHPRQFFGRERELRRLFGLWRRQPMQNAAIVGPRRGGKTSLLLHLRNVATIPEELRPDQRVDWLPEPTHLRWVYVDFQDSRHANRDGLLRHVLSAARLPAPPTGAITLDGFIDLVSRNLRTPLVILLDEVGVALERCPDLDNTFWEGMRSLATTQVGGQIAFVLAAPVPPTQLADGNRLSSSFFNIFGYTARLGPLAETEARALVASSPVPFSPSDTDWILARSGCWPLLLQVLCRERLMALELGDADDTWQAEALLQIGSAG